MGAERRKNKRLPLNVNLEIERLSQGDGITTVKYVEVVVSDLSKTGIGFTTGVSSDIGTFYIARIKIWTSEIVESVIKIVRCTRKGKIYEYGGVFVGMMDADAMKIEIYQMIEAVQKGEL